MITLQTFEDNLDRWGGALERWPPEARREAEALLSGSAPARALHGAMTEVETALAPPAFETAGVERFATVATRHAQERPSIPRRAPPMAWRAGWGAAAAAALVLGILVGDANSVGHDENPGNLLASALDSSTGSVDVE